MTSDSFNQRARELVNVQYSVFLGVIFSLSFYVDSSGQPAIKPVLSLHGRPEAVLFIIYFVLDWFTANVVERRRFPSPGHLLLRVAWVAVLGATVISLSADGLWKLWLLAVYVIISGLYDLWFTWRLLDRDATPETVRGLLLAGIRFLVGLSFVIPVLMGAIGRDDVVRTWDNPQTFLDCLFGITALYVLLKIGRFFYLLRVRVPDTAVVGERTHA
ncbi:MAG: hypothetical protein KBG29_01250 [Pseudomonadales bacterium]|nr:hypothetical protein [Pseudomonadales bacterium]